MNLSVVVPTLNGRDQLADGLDALSAHREHLAGEGRDTRVRERYAAAIRALLREDAGPVLERALDRQGGADALARQVADGESDPHAAVETVLAPLVDCLDKDK